MLVVNSLLVIWVTLPALVWTAQLSIRQRIHPALLCILCLLTMTVGYFILPQYVRALDSHLSAEINKFDLDGDGGVSGDEWTPEARRASDEWASDTGRSMALYFAGPFTAIWYTIVFAGLFGREWVLRHIFPTRSSSVHAPTDSETAEQQTDDENPYRPPIVG